MDNKYWIDTSDLSKNLKKEKSFKVISLFSGCGGKDLGVIGGFEIFKQNYGTNNFNIVYANDIESHACKTYKHNFKHEIENADIQNVDANKLPKADIVIGGFPCQDFSLAGNREGLNSSRGLLYLHMKRVIDKVKPNVFVAENVEGLTNLNGDETLEKIKTDLKSSGYNVEHHLFNASDYGVPQSRKRVIIIGIKKTLLTEPIVPYPIATHSNNGLVSWMTSKSAIDDLWDALGKDKFFNHSVNDYSKAKFYPGRKMQGNLRIDPNRPSPTIRSEHHGNIEGHYRTLNDTDTDDMSQWRRLTIRECARLQTFPDNFEFPVSSSSAYKEIGNAVPPVFSWHIFRALNLFLIKSKISPL
jgi:DNA (cytosine-5)-methyltransferase 1